jgi:beta-lactamase class A
VLALLTPGLTLTLRDAATLMIVQSDNTATDLCFDAVGGPDPVNRLMRALGLDSIQAVGTTFDWFRQLASSMDPRLGELSPGELYAAGYPEQTPEERAGARASYHFGGGAPFGLASAADLGRLLELLWRGTAVSTASSAEALRVMRLQQHRARIPRYLIGAACAHKTGDFEPYIANDVGLVEPYGCPPAIVVFLNARHRGLWANLDEAVARMAEKVWERALELGS